MSDKPLSRLVFTLYERVPVEHRSRVEWHIDPATLRDIAAENGEMVTDFRGAHLIGVPVVLAEAAEPGIALRRIDNWFGGKHEAGQR